MLDVGFTAGGSLYQVPPVGPAATLISAGRFQYDR
jgi:hypothetical protein